MKILVASDVHANAFAFQAVLLARFGLFDVSSREVEIFAVKHEVEAAVQAVLSAGSGHKIAERLAFGR